MIRKTDIELLLARVAMIAQRASIDDTIAADQLGALTEDLQVLRRQAADPVSSGAAAEAALLRRPGVVGGGAR